MFNENWHYLVLETAVISLIFTILGFITSRNLPEKQRKIHIRKFALIGLAIIFICLPIFKPYISSYSRTENLDKLKTDNLVSVEEIAKFEIDQTYQIERLKNEVEHLREDINQTDLYYSTVVKLLSTGIAVVCFSFAFGFRKEEKDLEEIQSNIKIIKS